MYLAVCAILWSAGIQVNIGELTQGQVVAFVSYMTQALLSIVYVANLVVVFTKASASAARVNEVLSACQPSVTDEGAEPVELWSSAGLPGAAERADADLPSGAEQVPTLALRNVSFAYPGAAADAVHDATLTLMSGQTLGVIGGTGSGKSTLVSLIPRLYDATEGAVEVLGRDVRAWQLKQLRQVVGMVPEQAMLVSGTISSNLIWRDAKATDDDLWRALELAQAAEFVRALADGLDAPVEAGGKNFSGGQRQRFTVRALVGAPKLLILDDSASALDYKTDAALRVALASYGRDAAASGELPPAVVVVSQRVASVRAADLICVMRRGNVVGLGTHDELVRTCAVYQEICASQGVEDETVSPGMRQFHPAQLSHETVSPGTTVSCHEEVRHG